MLTTEAKLAVIKEYATHEGDTGSPEVQVAILTSRIQYLTVSLERTQKRPSFPSWFVEIWMVNAVTCLTTFVVRYRTLPFPYRTSWSS